MTTAERKQLSENPKYNVGATIEITNSYESTIPGLQYLTAGKYEIIEFRKPFMSSIPYDMVYGFKSTRKNSKNIFVFNQSWVETNSNLL